MAPLCGNRLNCTMEYYNMSEFETIKITNTECINE